MQTIERRGRQWKWPKNDTKLIRVFDQVDDIDRILRHVHGRDVCVQAGGACGVWPARFAAEFERVYTFEPQPVNFACLLENTPESNVIRVQAALGYQRGLVGMDLHASEHGNAGAWYVRPGGSIPVMRIDDLGLDQCDLIQLDVEGAEFFALLGAQQTLSRFRPCVVIEEKQLPQGGEPLKARQFLQSLGYREAGRVHRDVILTC